MAIVSFADKTAEIFFLDGRLSKRAPWQGVRDVVRRKLDMLNYAARLEDLKAPPGNRLENLAGSLKGFFSIRINDQWRIIFRWTAAGPAEIRITDYH